MHIGTYTLVHTGGIHIYIYTVEPQRYKPQSLRTDWSTEQPTGKKLVRVPPTILFSLLFVHAHTPTVHLLQLFSLLPSLELFSPFLQLPVVPAKVQGSLWLLAHLLNVKELLSLTIGQKLDTLKK